MQNFLSCLILHLRAWVLICEDDRTSLLLLHDVEEGSVRHSAHQVALQNIQNSYRKNPSKIHPPRRSGIIGAKMMTPESGTGMTPIFKKMLPVRHANKARKDNEVSGRPKSSGCGLISFAAKRYLLLWLQILSVKSIAGDNVKRRQGTRFWQTNCQ